MSSPTQGMWVCRHNVDGRDFCPECHKPSDEMPVATWNAFSPDQLADVITGVTRSDPAFGLAIASRLTGFGDKPDDHEFTTERRDPFSGVAIGAARWRVEHTGVSCWRLHLIEAEPGGVA